MERRILLVEDSPTQAERIRLLLEGEDYRVETAANGREGLQRIQSALPDLIISDVIMPEMDGYAFCQAVRSSETSKRIPFVLLTERKTPLDILKGLERGADNFITKPFEDDYLLERIRRIFEHLELRKAGRFEMEVAVRANGRDITISPDKQQIIELLFASFEEICDLNVQLTDSKKSLENYSKDLEAKVQERTQQLQRQQEVLRALYLASLEIQMPLELHERLDRLLETAQTVLELDRVNILLVDPEQRELRAVASLGVEEPLAAICVPIGPAGGALAEAYRTQQMVVWDGRAPLPEPLRLQPPYDQIEALSSPVFAIVPLVVQGQAIGVFGGDRKHSRRPLDPTTRELFQLFATQAALAIEYARLYETQRMVAVQLEATVEERTRELQATNAQLQEATRKAEEASRHKSQFLANMSHELRTPLNSILGFSELLEAGIHGPMSEKQAGFLRHIHNSGMHLLQLINDLLDLSKVEAGRLELRPEAFKLTDALTAALEEFRIQADGKGVALSLHLGEAPDILVADPLRFKQILYNLLSNAVKFTPASGSVTVTARTVRCAAEHTSETPEWVEIVVQDNGIGIKAEDLSRLFQEFTQLDSSIGKPQQGTGLGLALTKRLVALHGGFVTATSPGEGQGSTLTVTLPLPS